MLKSKRSKKNYHYMLSKITCCLLYQECSVPIGRIIVIFSLLFLMTIISAAKVSAQIHERFLKDDSGKKPWNIVADVVSYDDKTEQYIARGNVTITKNDIKLSCDFVRFDYKNMNAVAEGHVVMTTEEDIITGRRIEIDLGAETGTIYNGAVFYKENNFHIKSDKIQKTGKKTYAAKNIVVTTCDGDNPDWKITGKNLKVTVEGYGYVTHAALWAKKIPVLYSPFFSFPAKQKRQSGFLAPTMGDSDRKGTEYIQPFFWAISKSSDATFYAQYMSQRGEKLGLEYRYILDEQSKGTLMYDFLDDRKVDDGVGDNSSKWGYEDDDVLRPNSDRYWFRMKHDHTLPLGFISKLDLDVVSDQDYLIEFRDGYTGFEESTNYYYKNFGRGLDDYNDPTRVNRLNLNRNWFSYSLNAETRWYDNVINRRRKDSDPTLQMLPVISFNGSKQQIPDTPLYFDLGTEYTYFYREDVLVEDPRGHRFDIYPRLYWPYRCKNYFTFEPSVGGRHTTWHVDKRDGSDPEKDKTLNREYYDIRLEFSSDVAKVYNVNGKSVDRIKHLIKPQIIYDYVPFQKQERFPNFDSKGQFRKQERFTHLDAIDRIEGKNLITYSITNYLISRYQKLGEEKTRSAETEEQEPTNYNYKQFCRFKLGQSYDIKKEKDDLPEPFSPVFAELEIFLNRYLSIDADAEWSTYGNTFLSRDIQLDLSDKRGDKVSMDYSFTRNSSETITLDLNVALTENFSVYAGFQRNLDDDQDLEKGIGFLYKSQCWSIDCNYKDGDNEQQVAFVINLYGLGGFGTNGPGGFGTTF